MGMDQDQILVSLQETKDRSMRNEGRIKKLETQHESLRELATSVAVMAEQLKAMNYSVRALTGKVDVLEEKPAKKWEAAVDKIVWAVLAAVAAFLLGRIGL